MVVKSEIPESNIKLEEGMSCGMRPDYAVNQADKSLECVSVLRRLQLTQTKTRSHNENGEIKRCSTAALDMQHGTRNSKEAVRPQNGRMGATRDLNGQR